MKEIPPDLWPLLRLSDIAREGQWPVAGGTLDQADSFLEFAHFVWAYESAYEAKMNHG